MTTLEENINEIQTYKNRKVIVGWSCESGMGVNSFLNAAAVESARRGVKTVLVELDLLHASTSISLGMSHHTRNLESWITKSKESGENRAIRDYLVNSKIWMQDMAATNPGLEAAVSELPQDLYLLAPSQFLDRFQAHAHSMTKDTPYFIIEQLVDLGFEAIYMDIPSEILMPVTGTSMKLATDLLVFVDGHVAHSIYTNQTIKRIIGDHRGLKVMLNRAGTLGPGIEKLLGQPIWKTIPDDPTLSEKSLDLVPGGSDKYNAVVNDFCDAMGYKKKKKQATEPAGSRKGFLKLFSKS
ncbi:MULTISPECIES: hypothetical protein [Paenibacillus]|uniref:AAA domain-containing protein n=1 Tax=Paenibacillus vandeheii TaxID=3035917 RepID=A0ABT8JFV2_9BACL|nr:MULTISPECIES: hypothetical protein [Paenibacillus]KGP77789.1 hypothetical protein P364_0131485 [Paenibacillus sp. MAEPY2]KGP79564.1 hypothetical protein P363_0131030 [Paenibacillus sp. MAEPY1]MDN4603984.1 hypothetical protein [Paenibacillus vandeheii]